MTKKGGKISAEEVKKEEEQAAAEANEKARKKAEAEAIAREEAEAKKDKQRPKVFSDEEKNSWREYVAGFSVSYGELVMRQITQ